MKKHVVVIGSGFSGLAAASLLAKKNYAVTLLEKNAHTGGRCHVWEKDGFVFDMGPSWYWMPDVFERYFNLFGKSVSDFYTLKRLDPSYRVFFPDNCVMDIPATMDAVYALFESYEKGSSKALKTFLANAQFKYETAMRDLVFKPGKSFAEFASWKVISSFFKLTLLSPISKEIRTHIKHPYLQQLLEFPVLFLGAKPEKTPALYSLMNYADMQLGTWYPMGGMGKITEAMTNLAQSIGVTVVCNQAANGFAYNKNVIQGVTTHNQTYACDGVVASADYHFVDTCLLKDKKNYSEKYWQKRTLAPSSLLYFVGVSKKLKNLLHHNLFFDTDFAQHARDIYDTPAWPKSPLFYVCAPSVTDPSVAPHGHENLFILIPVSTNVDETEQLQENYFNLVIERIEKRIGETFKENILFKRNFAKKDFISTYNAFKGNAYGLANTLKQTAFLKPKIYNKKIKNLFYAGQLTVPGPGVPPALISGELAANEMSNFFTLTL